MKSIYAYTFGPIRIEIEADNLHEADNLLENKLLEWFPDGKMPKWRQFEVEYYQNNTGVSDE
jgi:hypothetical protein